MSTPWYYPNHSIAHGGQNLIKLGINMQLISQCTQCHHHGLKLERMTCVIWWMAAQKMTLIWFEIRKDDMCHMMNDSPKNDINISNFWHSLKRSTAGAFRKLFQIEDKISCLQRKKVSCSGVESECSGVEACTVWPLKLLQYELKVQMCSLWSVSP